MTGVVGAEWNNRAPVSEICGKVGNEVNAFEVFKFSKRDCR